MPLQIPQSQGPSVNPIVAPRVRSAPPPDPGGGRAADRAYGQARGLAGDVSEIALREEMKAQEAQFNELASRAEKAAFDRQLALSKVQRKGALQASQEAMRDYDKDLEGIHGEASSPLIRQRLAAHSERTKLGLQKFASAHAHNEMEQYAKESYAALKEDLFNTGVNSQDGLVRAMKYDEMMGAIKRNGASNGLAPEVIKVEMARDASAFHAGVTQTMIAQGKDREARDYFMANKDDMIPADIVRLEPRVKIAAMQNEALSLADQIMNSGENVAVDFEKGKFVKGPVTLEQAIEKSKDIEDLELRKQTQHELTRIYGINKMAEAQGYQDAVEAAYTAVEKGEKVPVELLARLNTTDRQRIKILESRIGDHETTEEGQQLLFDFNDQSPEEMAKMQPSDMLLLKKELSNEAYKRVEKAVLDAKQDAAKPDTRIPRLDHAELRFRMDEAGLGLDTLTATQKKNKQLSAFEDAKKRARSSAFVEFRSALASSEKRLSIPEQQTLFDEIVKRKAGHLLQTYNVNQAEFFNPFRGTIRRGGELEQSDFEGGDWEFPGEVTQKLDSISALLPNWSSLPTTVKTMRKNMAYVAQSQGQSDEFITGVLKGERTWPW